MKCCDQELVGDNFLITEGIPHAVSLQTYVAHWLPQLPPDQQRRLRWKLTRAMARICAAAHEAGVFHDDFHGGNVLVRVDTCSGDADDPSLPELFLVDLPGIRFSGPLNWSRSRQSLIMLNSDWSEKVSLVERWRFWRTYLAQRQGWKLADPRRAAGEIAWLTRDYACRIQRGRAKRALHTNRDFYMLETPQARGHAVADIAPADLVRLLEEPERFERQATSWPANEAGESSIGARRAARGRTGDARCLAAGCRAALVACLVGADRAEPRAVELVRRSCTVERRIATPPRWQQHQLNQ